MDRNKLEQKLNTDFKKECSKRGYPLEDICLLEAYPGDISTSFIVKIIASWVKVMDCSIALDFLIDVLWDTTEVEYRQAISSIKIYAEGALHCQSIGDIIENNYSPNFELI